MPQSNISKNKSKQMARLGEGAVVPTNDQETCWVFKRVLNSELDRHLIYKVVYVKDLDFVSRGGWKRYFGQESVDKYIVELDQKNGWGNPWAK